MNELAKKIFDETVDNLIDGVDEKYYDDLKNGYFEYLCNRYKKYSIEDADVFINLMRKSLLRSGSLSRLSTYIQDDELENIRHLSQNGLDKACYYAENILSKGDRTPIVDSNELEESTISLREGLSKVKEFNQDIARNLISEGVLDYNFAAGKTDFMSFRLGHRYCDLLDSVKKIDIVDKIKHN